MKLHLRTGLSSKLRFETDLVFDARIAVLARHWESLPKQLAEQYRTRIEQLSHFLSFLGGG